MKKTIVFLFAITLIISCKKNQLGGKSTVKGSIKHHSKVIPYATVFIKFDATDFPGSDTTAYDDKVRADADGNYSFKCYKGHYYLYGRGIDNALSPPIVVGGLPVKVRNNETVEANVAVTED
jgi:hypothetical protein